MLRPTRFIKCSKAKDGFSGFDVPVSVSFRSGHAEPMVCRAFPEIQHVTGATVSTRLMKRAGDRAETHAVRWRSKWGPVGELVVPIDVEIRRFKDSLMTSGLALVRELPEHRDLELFDPFLDSLADYFVSEEYISLNYPKILMFSSLSLDTLLHSAVLVLGHDDDEHLRILRAIETAVNYWPGHRGWLLRDYADVAGRDLRQKLFTMAAASALIIVEDSKPSGHFTELPLIHDLGTPIAILRGRRARSTWMLDPLTDSKHVKVFTYDIEANAASLWKATVNLCAWAQRWRRRKAAKLDHKYPWRQAERELEEAVWPRRRVL